jgi:hypothetical protein
MTGNTIGRIVHYMYGNGEHTACMIVRVNNEDGCVNLVEFNDKQSPYTRLHTSVNYSEVPTAGCWHWIEPA